MKIEVIPADEPKEIKLNWTVKEYCGTPIFKRDAADVYLSGEDDIKIGDIIIVWGSLMEVKANASGKLYGDSENLLSSLEFDKDDRHCWVSGAMVNKRGVANGRKTAIIGQ